MHRKLELREGFEVDVAVSTKSAWINPDDRHQPRKRPQELVREDVVEQRPRLERPTRLRVKCRISSALERQRSGLMHVDVIRMAVTAHRIKGQDHIGPDLPDVLDDPSGHLFDRVRDLGIGVGVVAGAGHA